MFITDQSLTFHIYIFGLRYKTTVSSAREKVYTKIVHTETDMAQFDWLLFTYK